MPLHIDHGAKPPECPTAALDNILCRVGGGGAAVRTMFCAEDLVVDDPDVVVEDLQDISTHAKELGPTHFVYRTVDLEGCATQISHKVVSRVVAVRVRQDARQRHSDDFVLTLVTVTKKRTADLRRHLRATGTWYQISPSSLNTAHCALSFGRG